MAPARFELATDPETNRLLYPLSYGAGCHATEAIGRRQIPTVEPEGIEPSGHGFKGPAPTQVRPRFSWPEGWYFAGS